MSALQWGGRFAAAADGALLSFGSSLEEDLFLAPFDVAGSLAHVAALEAGGIVGKSDAHALRAALRAVRAEIASGEFARCATHLQAEDVHGAIDTRVRALAGTAGERLHAGRSRNDQVATALLLYVRDRSTAAGFRSKAIAASLARRARSELAAGTLLAGCTHRQPAQPVLLAFVLAAWSEPFVRAARRFARAKADARAWCPLGSGALSGSSLPLDRTAASDELDFDAPSRNALDAIGNRDAALDLAHACVRVIIDASRVCEELIAWCAPAYGYVRLDDAAATGSSLMPQKRNPDPFELVRARAATLVGAYAGAQATLCGLAPSYQRDLQETKAATIAIVERTLSALDAFERAWDAVRFVRTRMNAAADSDYTIATDLADALIVRGTPARAAHALVGCAVTRAEGAGRAFNRGDLEVLAREAGHAPFDAPLDALSSVGAKRTIGSTAPAQVASQLDALDDEIAVLDFDG